MYNFSRDPRFIEPYYSKTNRIFIDDAMKEIGIPKHLKNIEKEYNIRILLAVESGSRAWGFASTNSDWDVRFVYVHKPEWYLRVEPQPNVIEHMFDDDVDLVGWELRKALSLFGRSNPSLFEWLNSPQVYYMDKEFESRLKEVEATFFNPIKNMYHYNHIYNKHNERYLQHEKCELKRFLYYLRGILASGKFPRVSKFRHH